MEVRILEEHGLQNALLGLSLSYNGDPEKMMKVALGLAHQQGGHNKFLESIMLWLDITAPRYWWQQFDTYRVGVTKQSESTMHTMTQRLLTQEDFEHPILESYLDYLNRLIEQKDWMLVKIGLPEAFKQRRIVAMNYKALQWMILQRKNHRLPEWQEMIGVILGQVEHPEFLVKEAQRSE